MCKTQEQQERKVSVRGDGGVIPVSIVRYGISKSEWTRNGVTLDKEEEEGHGMVKRHS